MNLKSRAWVGLASIALIATSPGLISPAHGAASEPRGLDAVEQFERLPYLKDDTLAAGQSSFDRSGGNGDFGNFLRIEGTNKVLLDVTGPGTVYRLWFTGFNQSADYLRVYFDGESTPRIDMLLKDLFAGTRSPFPTPLVGNDSVSSGGFYCYVPLPFKHAIKIISNATAGSFYYNIGCHTYSPDTRVTTWTGAENPATAVQLWKNAGNDPKPGTGNLMSSNIVDLAAASTQTLLDVPGPCSLSAIHLHIPGIEPATQVSIADNGRAHKGYSQFQMSLDPANTGATLVRRLDYAIGNQKASVTVDGQPVGDWYDAGADTAYPWHDSRFDIPAALTAGKKTVTIRVTFASSDFDWNEFYYWAWSVHGTTTHLTDSLDVGDPGSEASHAYVIHGQTWAGDRMYAYPPVVRPDQNDLLSNLWLSISFDDETNPSVLAPIGSFFAMGQFAAYPVRALPVGLDDRTNLYSYFPMPFARRAVVKLISQRSLATANLTCVIKYKPFTDSLANVGCFKARFNHELPTTNGCDIVFLDTEGAGHLVGVVENMMGPRDRSYLEGDERIYVDDSRSPAFYGTGTEDFYNSGWYFNHGLFTLPMQGNPAHVADANYDCTTAYRLFLQDAIPFRKHIRAGIEHGSNNTVSENTWTLAYYYYQPAARAVLTDQLHVGKAAEEAAHHYSITHQTWSGSQSYSYDGNFDGVILRASGRAHQGSSQFTLSLLPANTGAMLRRQFDQGVANQKAEVYVDGTRAGIWYRAGGNPWHRWRDDDFIIPRTLTAGKRSIQIRIQFLSSDHDWNEFTYSLYSLTGPADASAP